MIDLDDFDPMGKQWEPAKEDFVGNKSSDEVADEALRVAALMLRTCGGCPILPQLQEILWEYYNSIKSNSLWSPALHNVTAVLFKQLEQLSQSEEVCDKRIDTVAVRSTMRMALRLQENPASKPLLSKELFTQLAACVIKDLIGHSFLDIARSIAVGQRFATNEEAFQFYEEVMAHLEPGVIHMGRRLTGKPTAERIKRYRVIKKVYTTSTMLYNDEFSCEL